MKLPPELLAKLEEAMGEAATTMAHFSRSPEETVDIVKASAHNAAAIAQQDSSVSALVIAITGNNGGGAGGQGSSAAVECHMAPIFMRVAVLGIFPKLAREALNIRGRLNLCRMILFGGFPGEDVRVEDRLAPKKDQS